MSLKPLLTRFGISACVAGCGLLCRGADWPQWMGPERNGQVHGSAWPTTLNERALTQTWRVDLGPSYSGPVVVSNRVFTTETVDKKREMVRALDRQTGKDLWHVEWEGALSVSVLAKANGDWIRSTPACDGESLYVAGMREVLVCLDAATGKERWRVDFVKVLKSPLPDFGCVCSPLVDGDAVYLQAGAGFVKLDKHSGAVLWQVLKDVGNFWGSAFSSPVIAEVAGHRQALVQTREHLAGVDPVNGTVYWSQRVSASMDMNIQTPVPFGDGVFTSAYGGKSILFKLTREGEMMKASQAWSEKGQGYMSTPVVVEGAAYQHLRNQHVRALDLLSGKELWNSKESFGKYWSLVANGPQMLALDERGLLYLLHANREKFDCRDQRKIADSETWAYLAVVDDQLFIRELHALTAWRWRMPAPAKTP